MAEAKKRRSLHFALSGALLVPGLAAGCGPEEEGPMINVPADDPPEVEETANPIGEEPPEVEPLPEEPTTDLTDEPTPPEPTANPNGNGLPEAAIGDSHGDARANPTGDGDGMAAILEGLE